jgi:quercetin dioxygenase-like cupin family protein
MEYRTKRERVHIKSLTGEVSQLCFIKLEHGEVTDHTHENEQIGYVLRGEIEITVEGLCAVLRPGDGYIIPANVRHGFRVVSLEPVEYVEVFSPPKASNR